MHSRTTVFCNFFFAKAPFWNAWKAILDRLFDLADRPGSSLHSELNRPLAYMKDSGEKKAALMKVFVMERAASFLLATSKTLAIRNFPPFEMPLTPRFVGRLPELVVLDALKIAFTETRESSFCSRVCGHPGASPLGHRTDKSHRGRAVPLNGRALDAHPRGAIGASTDRSSSTSSRPGRCTSRLCCTRPPCCSRRWSCRARCCRCKFPDRTCFPSRSRHRSCTGRRCWSTLPA